MEGYKGRGFGVEGTRRDSATGYNVRGHNVESYNVEGYEATD